MSTRIESAAGPIAYGKSTDRKLGRRTAASSGSGIRAEYHPHHCLRTALVLDDDRNLSARPQLCEHSCEIDTRRSRAVVHGLDRVADPNPRLRGGPAARDRADDDAVPVRVSHSDGEEGALPI